ncbi:MAG: UDP-glucose/GDP-mannose dehydrogenase family protein [Candidatus Eisenbacteria bacterium]|nr:UDP-glucose/GDP-mannose dehydrogenase family protein [Candidatus Eisenbacteria bacterium]
MAEEREAAFGLAHFRRGGKVRRLAVIGAGYVGLVSAACFADFGNEVVCVDTDAARIDGLRRLKMPFYEPGLLDLVRRNTAESRLTFSTSVADAVARAEVVFIAVGTPASRSGEADLSGVRAVARQIAANMRSYKLIVQKSTVPVGTGAMVRSIVRRYCRKGVSFDVASNPEFLREGSAIENFMRPDRVVIGTWSKKAESMLSEIYAPLYLIETPMVKTTVETAELIKYAANVFLATKVSFINEMARLCETLGADVQVVAKAVGLDRRIGPKFLHAGPGIGGSCLPKDTAALVRFAEAAGHRLLIPRAVQAINKSQRTFVLEKIEKALGGLKGKTVGVLGLSFKPETDDVRDSPAVYVTKAMLSRGARVRVFDPAAMQAARALLPRADYCKNAYEVCRGASGLVIFTEWNEFRRLDLARVKGLLKRPVMVDLRNVYEPDELRAMGFKYFGVGRPHKTG